MIKCAKCLYPENTKPFIFFDEKGVCSGCRVHEEKEKIDWKERENILKRFVSNYKKDTGYDCIIPVSGGKDSHYQVHYVVNELNLRPLLVTFNHLDNSAEGIKNLENLIVKFGLDHIRFTPSPEVVKKCCRHAIKTMGDPFWHEHAGIYTFPVKIAVLYKIPLIIWGEYGFMDIAGMYSHKDFIEMSKKNRQEHGMRGMEASDFVLGNNEGLTERDLEFTVYPSDKEIQEVGIKGIYLSNFINWDPFKQAKLMIEEYGFTTAEKERTPNIYENAECYFNDTVHDYFKFLKFGYGRATDHASQLIRYGHITREEGEEIVNYYDVIKDHEKLHEFCDWVEMDIHDVITYVLKYADFPLENLTKVPEPILSENYKYAFIENHLKKETNGRKFI